MQVETWRSRLSETLGALSGVFSFVNWPKVVFTMAQWPDESMLPGFKVTMEGYLAQIQALGYKFIGLLAEAFGLPSDALARFYDSDDLMQHRGKVWVIFPIFLPV